jgi:alkanesulfonate monooxygenase SsuD/methylene tetrahydromethanopterin reductase-like flavin-dependent oxidoreductase (luciferase family)
MFMMRFGMRAASPGAAERADLYAACVDMCAWAQDRGGVAAVLSQHHGVEDGYLPSPLPLAAAIAARTTTLPITVAALLLAFYEPVKLAEDMAVIDLIARGRVSYVVGIGYRAEEFSLFGIDRAQRAAAVEERIAVLRRLWAGETVQLDGRPVRVTPLPFTAGGPFLAYGGGSEAAARRARNAHRVGTSSVSFATTVDALRSEHGSYQILTPQEARRLSDGGVVLGLQPLVGGLPPEIGWRYLESAAAVFAK